MKTLIAFLASALLANSLWADPYSAAIKQAKTVTTRVSNANRQLDTPPPSTPPAQNTPPPNPALQATLQNIESLKNDFTAIITATNATTLAAEKQSLMNNLAAAAQGAKASQKSISKLADDLAAVIAGNEKLRAQLPKLAQFSHAVFNGAHLTDAQQQAIFDGVQKILTGAGVPAEGAGIVVEDFKAIATETK